MKKIFLDSPHWFVFLIVFGIPFTFHVSLQIYFSLQFIEMIEKQSPSEDMVEFFDHFKWFLFIPVVYLVIGFSWIGSVVYGLRLHIPAHLLTSDKLFKVALAVPVLYFAVSIYFFFGFSFSNMLMFNEPDIAPIVMLYLVSILLFPAVFYMFYFVAKTLKTLELGRTPLLSECIPDIILVWFFPIGIWFLQPRINSAVNEKTNDPVDHLLTST